MGAIIHPTAEVSERARIGEGTRIWHHAQVREGAVIGRGCVLGKDVYVDVEVVVGDHCKLQNGVYLYRGVVAEDGVFFGPRATTTNDRTPRAIDPEGRPKGEHDWELTPTRVCRGAAIGAGAVIVCGVTIGAFAMVAAGAVVTRSVPEHGLVMGNPARLCGAVCPCGARLRELVDDGAGAGGGGARAGRCGRCGRRVPLPEAVAAAVY